MPDRDEILGVATPVDFEKIRFGNDMDAILNRRVLRDPTLEAPATLAFADHLHLHPAIPVGPLFMFAFRDCARTHVGDDAI